MKKRIGIIGCGFIGSEVAKAIESQLSESAELVAVCDIAREKALSLVESLKSNVAVLPLPELFEQVDLVVEAAAGSVVRSILEGVLAHKKDALIISSGGLLGCSELMQEAITQGIKISIPSGAVGGIDALKSASAGKIYSVSLTTRKPIEGLRGAPYLEEKGINLDTIIGEEVIFEGKAVDAIKHFPKNVNVSVTLSLAGIGPERTNVKIITSRTYKKNSHEVIVEGDFGRMQCLVENDPSPINPKTSYLASLSCIATLKKIIQGADIGT